MVPAEMSPSDHHHFLAAQGWLELGNPSEADKELAHVKSASDPDVLEMRWVIRSEAKDWAACVDLGRRLIRSAPERTVSWLHCAYALHELKRTREAWDVLLPVAQKFPADPTIPYNLACYACQLGDLVAARDWLAQAFRLGNAREIRAQASVDPDLAPLWESPENE
jgi:predicted Zn-dependent protease